jgi:hypothetical protein
VHVLDHPLSARSTRVRLLGVEKARSARGRAGWGGMEGSFAMHIELLPAVRPQRVAWNKGRIIGQKRPLQPKHVWSIRVRLEMADNPRDLALFNMAIDSKLRGCDLVHPPRQGCLCRWPGERACVDHPAQDRSAGQVRDHRAHPPISGTLDRGSGDGGRGVSLAEPLPRQPTPFHPAVCPHPAWLGHFHRSRAERLWHPFDAQDEGRPDLSGRPATCERSSCCSATPRWTARSATSASSSMTR